MGAVPRSHLSVLQKIVAGIAAVIVTSVLTVGVVYQGSSRTLEALRQLADVRGPSYAATLEVELNLNGVVLATLAYLDDADPEHRLLMEKDTEDVERYLDRFRALAATEQEERLAETLGERWAELRSVTGRLFRLRDEQSAAWERVVERFARADSLIESGLRGAAGGSGSAAAAASFARLESDLAGVALAIGNRRPAAVTPLRAALADHERSFRQTLAALGRLTADGAAARETARLGVVFDSLIASVAPLIERDEQLRRGRAELIGLRAELDALLDEEIQLLGARQLREPREAAERTATAVLRQARWLLLLVVGVAAATTVILVRSIRPPLRRLRAGAEEFGRGNLEHRIGLPPGDEFAAVAAEFDRMAEQLRRTTVSRERLAESERQLQLTVAELREQIAERERSEAERARLEASLRRSETMSAMGSLVAGVAHEVRNPLFGITSVLDAMEARFGARDEYRRYLPVLRDQAERLNHLMRDLLDYGRPPEPNLTAGSLAELLQEAITCCTPLAEQAAVQLRLEVPTDSAPLEFDRPRLLRVFVNLIENAIQHSPAGATVCVLHRAAGEPGALRAETTVTDSGPGFDSVDLLRVFEPFYGRRHGGTGLGLSIVQRIVEEHGGEVVAGNRAGGGAVVSVAFPLPISSPALIPT